MLLTPKPRQVRELKVNGERPFAKWFGKLKNKQAKATILGRLTRIKELGGFGNYKYLDHGVFELKIEHGPGYRIYFALEGDAIVLLLLGGDKSTQQRDIQKSIKLWSDYVGSKD